jgi:alkylated DNA repair dioxygenase AlkB
MYTFTFSDCGENHVGNQQIGERSASGFSLANLENVKRILEEKYGLACETIDLRRAAGFGPGLEVELEEAFVLVGRSFVQSICPGFGEQELHDFSSIQWDTKYYDTRRKRVLNKHARSNTIVADFNQEPDYESGKGRVIAFCDAPGVLGMIRDEFNTWGPEFTSLIAEGNNYHTPGQTGIGWHGDTERSKVAAVRFGSPCSPIMFQWFHRAKPQGKTVEIPLEHGDLYIMSEKAVGTDWKMRSKWTLRHSTGAAKFTSLKKY